MSGRYPNSRLPERKQVFSVNPIVYTNSLGTVLSVNGGENPPQVQVLRSGPRAHHVSWPSKYSTQACCVHSPLHRACMETMM